MRAVLRPTSVDALIRCHYRSAAAAMVTLGSRHQYHSTSQHVAPMVNIEGMKQRPAKIIYDHLAPMPSRLLTTTLSDLLLSGQSPNSTNEDAPSPSSSPPPSLPLPQGHHLVYFPLQTPASRLAADGADPDHSPGPDFPRRLWAGGEVTFRPRPTTEQATQVEHHGLILDGRAWTCREEIENVSIKGGQQDKVFVELCRRYGLGHNAGGPGGAGREWDIEEKRTLVFMSSQEQQQQEQQQNASSTSPPRLIKYPHPPTYSASITPTPTHLFHFSALTYNAHSIHIDPLFARSTDGHRALLVHGPLSLALMLRVLNDCIETGATGSANTNTNTDGPPQGHKGAVVSFSYRNYAPLYVGENMRVCVRRVERGAKSVAVGDGYQTWDVWVEGPEGGLAVKGTAIVNGKST